MLEAALAETGARFALRARDLVALDDAGVPGNVIDLMIAASYPEKFQVERRAAATRRRVSADVRASLVWSGYWGLGYPYFYSYPGYDVDYRDYYSPYGYAYPGSYYYYPGSSVVVGDDGERRPPDGGGRVVERCRLHARAHRARRRRDPRAEPVRVDRRAPAARRVAAGR